MRKQKLSHIKQKQNAWCNKAFKELKETQVANFILKSLGKPCNCFELDNNSCRAILDIRGEN